MTEVYKERRGELLQHYDKEIAKICTFKPATHSTHATHSSQPKRPTSAPPGGGGGGGGGSDDELIDAPLDYRQLQDANELFTGLEAGGWLHGDASAEAALLKLHSSMARLQVWASRLDWILD